MASINVMEERPSHALTCPEDMEFGDVCLFAPRITGRGTVLGHRWVTGALPALSMCQAGRRAVGCAGKGGSGPEYQLNAGSRAVWGLGDVKESQTNAFPSLIPASQWRTMPCCHDRTASRAGTAIPLLPVTL